jgi:hypothetical protein
MELKLAVATIVSRLRISIDTERCSLTSIADVVQQSRTQLTLKQLNPAWLRMAPRVALAGATTAASTSVPLR